jgi:MOSC domain-containing protein YiiM
MANELKIVSVNVGQRETVQIGNKPVETGIFKRPSPARVAVSEQGLADDVVVDTANHGGADQAMYLYSLEDYAWWSAELQKEVLPSTFGENVTLSSFGEAPLKIGDRLQLNDVLVEVTAPRIPCAKLAAKMADPGFIKRFARARRPGVYVRVLKTGTVQVGDPVQLLPASEAYPTVLEVADIWYAQERDPALLRRGLAAPLAERAKGAFRYWLGE